VQGVGKSGKAACAAALKNARRHPCEPRFHRRERLSRVREGVILGAKGRTDETNGRGRAQQWERPLSCTCRGLFAIRPCFPAALENGMKESGPAAQK